MKEKGILVFVRQGTQRGNHQPDIRLARKKQGKSCMVCLLGKYSESRINSLRKYFQSTEENIIHPPKLRESDDKVCAKNLCKYLSDTRLRLELKSYKSVDIYISEDMETLYICAIMESLTQYPRVSLYMGETKIAPHTSWDERKINFQINPTQALDIVGEHSSIRVMKEKILRYAPRPESVLIIGETGVGKELVARALHNDSERSGRFMAVNAAELPEELALSELFGHKKGAFTGAKRDRQGRIKESKNGTFFLDELFHLKRPVQAMLLRAFNQAHQGKISITPLGDTISKVITTRLVTAAQFDPRVERERGDSLRMELYYRIAAGVIHIPPLRERLSDIPLLYNHFMVDAGADPELHEDVESVLRTDYQWPGNVREFQVVLHRARMDADDIAAPLHVDGVRRALDSIRLPEPKIGLPSSFPYNLKKHLLRMEIDVMEKAIALTEGNATKAGRLIGLKNGRSFDLEARRDALEKQEKKS